MAKLFINLLIMSLKRKHLSLETKIALISAISKGEKQVEVATKFNLTKTTVNGIWLKKDKLLQEWTKTGGQIPYMKRIRPCANAEMEAALTVWFTQQRSQNVPISGPLLLEKAKFFAEQFGVQGFKGSNGYLEKFKKRHGLVFKVVSGEAASANTIEAEAFLQNILPPYLQRFSPKDIFNVDETGLFYDALPNKTLAKKNEICTGFKASKKRLTVLVGANMDGSEKCKLLVIGKYKKPRCFKNVKTLPVDYRSNRKAWMTSDLWSEWLHSFDTKMQKAGRKVLLVVDNVSSHKKNENLRSVELLFLPPNCTSKIQPCDQGIIQSLKLNYRRRCLEQLLLWLDAKNNINEFKVTVLDAINICATSWNCVNSQTIANCFRHGGWSINSATVENNEEPDFANSTETEARNVYDFLFRQFGGLLGPNTMEANDYFTVDDQLITEEILSDDAIVHQVTKHLFKLGVVYYCPMPFCNLCFIGASRVS